MFAYTLAQCVIIHSYLEIDICRILSVYHSGCITLAHVKATLCRDESRVGICVLLMAPVDLRSMIFLTTPTGVKLVFGTRHVRVNKTAHETSPAHTHDDELLHCVFHEHSILVHYKMLDPSQLPLCRISNHTKCKRNSHI